MSICDVARLSPRRYCLQTKADGCYAEVHTDDSGAVRRILSRSGADLMGGEDLIGVRAFSGRAILVGELEAHTERGCRDRDDRGWANVHLFDLVAPGSYRERRDALWRGQSAITCDASDLSSRSDASRRYHDEDGRFCSRPAPLDWRRFPIVPSLPVSAAADLWDMAREDVIEGFVVVDLEAPIGRRNAKRKVKPVDSIDCVVVDASADVARVKTFGKSFIVGCRGLSLSPGDVVEVCHNGWYATGEPRFPRIERKRPDLQRKRQAI